MDYKRNQRENTDYIGIEMDGTNFTELVERVKARRDFIIIRRDYNFQPIVLFNDVDEFPCYHAIASGVQYGEEGFTYHIQASPAFMEYLTTFDPPLLEEYDFQRALDMMFGNGSGEELHDYVTHHGLTTREADILIHLLYAIDVGNEF